MRLAPTSDRVEPKPPQEHREEDPALEAGPRRSDRERLAGDPRDADGMRQRHGGNRVCRADGAVHRGWRRMTAAPARGRSESLASREGQRVPDVSFRTRVDGEWVELSTRDLFAGKTVVVFSLPGAFTPTCSASHLPRFEQLADEIRAHGVDDVLCISVNDAFVMNAWAKEQCCSKVRVIPDGNGAFTEAMGMLVDKSDLGFGKRSWRYSMLVRDGVIEKMFIEPKVEGDPYEVSDADTMLCYLESREKREKESDR
jgi:peroxiredoxin